MTQGFLIVVLGIGLIYLVLSGKLDCIIASFRACAGSSTPTTSTTPTSTTTPTTNTVKPIMTAILSEQIHI